MQRTQILTIFISWNWKKAKRPASLPAGSDLIQTYYKENGNCFCEVQDILGTVSSTCYSPDFSRCDCTVNADIYPEELNTLGNVLRMLPMRAILLRFHTLFLHAAQVSLKGTGILFTAPSGTGKTTQAKLWKKYRNGQIVCSDRTLARKINGVWKTYGYPLDGSEPVRSGEVNRTWMHCSSAAGRRVQDRTAAAGQGCRIFNAAGSDGLLGRRRKIAGNGAFFTASCGCSGVSALCNAG